MCIFYFTINVICCKVFLFQLNSSKWFKKFRIYVIIIMVNNMNSRMERYKVREEAQDNVSTSSRVSRNTNLYQDIKSNELSRVRTNTNVKVIENSGKTIDIDKIKRYIESVNKVPREGRRKLEIEESREDKNVNVQENSTPKDYDINSVLEKAKQTREIDYERERYKKLRDTQYDILSKIEMYDTKETSKEALEEEFNTDERTLIDLINTVTIHKGDVNLLDELVSGDGETTEPIEKEKEKDDIKEEIKKQEENSEKVKKVDTTAMNLQELVEKASLAKTQDLVDLKEKTTALDKSFYTNSVSFSKEDFEGFEELEKSVKKNSVVTTIMIIVLVVFIIATLVVMANYVFDLGLFK